MTDPYEAGRVARSAVRRKDEMTRLAEYLEGIADPPRGMSPYMSQAIAIFHRREEFVERLVEAEVLKHWETGEFRNGEWHSDEIMYQVVRPHTHNWVRCFIDDQSGAYLTIRWSCGSCPEVRVTHTRLSPETDDE